MLHLQHAIEIQMSPERPTCRENEQKACCTQGAGAALLSAMHLRTTWWSYELEGLIEHCLALRAIQTHWANLRGPGSNLLNHLTDFVHLRYADVKFDVDFKYSIYNHVSFFAFLTILKYHPFWLP